MGSKSPKPQRPNCVKSNLVAHRVPQEIVDEILDHLAADSDSRSLRSKSLVSKSWLESCRRHIFCTIFFTPKDMAKWLEIFPVPERSPAHHVRDLTLSLGGHLSAPETFFEHTPWFTNVETMTLLGYGWFLPLSMSPSAKLPQSTTSLIINTDAVAVTQIRDIMAQLPNLNHLTLSGTVPFDSSTLSGMGTVLRGRFGGQLRLINGNAGPDVTNMLLEIPTGLHFTEVEIHGTYECLLSTVRLAESCVNTLVKLSYMVSLHDGREPFERSFDCSIFPNLQEVNFRIGWITGSLRWIPMALSTLKPTTSPRLSAVLLNFFDPPSGFRSTEVSIEEVGNDLRQVADEVTRIKGEFKGMVNLTVCRDLLFKGVLDTHHVWVYFPRRQRRTS